MAEVTISDLTAATSVSGSELLEIEQSGTSKKATALLIAALAGTGNDSDDNYSANNFLTGYATHATAAGTTTLTVASEYQQYFTGSTTQTVKLPVASTLVLGHRFFIANASTGDVTVQSSGLNTVATLGQDESAMLTCILASGTSAASWSVVTAGTGGVYTVKYSANQTLLATECYGGVIYVDAAATMTLPAMAAGMSVTVITIGAVAVSVDPNASEILMLDGTALTGGHKATNLSTAGDIIVLTYYASGTWYAASNSWTDGG